ncbi:MAG TPA: hypothetical protein VFE93_09795 [Myxococcaceae bacterium]|nr:hypothetical protein [Myxococcaceae bacterium]
MKWLYSVVLEPGEDGSKLSLYRVQAGTETRFLWSVVDVPALRESPMVDDVLEVLYAGVLELMQATV